MNSFNGGWTATPPSPRSTLRLDLCRKVESFEPEPLESAYRALTAEIGLKAGQLFGTIRVAVTGRRVAPPLFDTMAAIGREKCMTRLENARKLHAGNAEA